MIKRFMPAVLISPALLISLASFMILGCADKKSGSAEAAVEEKVIAASFYPMYIAALNITENVPGIRVVNMAPTAAGCMHDYQMTAADAMLIEKAEVLIINGAGLDTFLDKAATSNKNLTVINASGWIPGGDCVNDVHIDPHVWMSVNLHIRQITHIAEKLAEWDTVNAHAYADNAQRYADRLTALATDAYGGQSELSTAVNRNIVISHSGFVYLTNQFYLKVTAVVERGSGAEPGAADIVRAVNTIKQEKVKAIFVEKGHHSPASKTISTETGVPIFELNMIVSGPDEKDAYINAMKKNVLTLTEALR